MHACTCRNSIGAALPDSAASCSDLAEALARVRHLYCENSPKDLLIDALDALIGCARRHFDEDGRHLRFRDGIGHDGGMPMQGNIVEYMKLLRQYVAQFDNFGLLPDLNFIDHWLKAAMSEESPHPALPTYGSRQRRLVQLVPSRTK